MPITLAALANRRKTIDFEWPDDAGKPQKVSLTYNPGWLTGEREADISSWEARSLGEKNANWLSAMLISWDVLGTDGKPYPTDYDSIFKLDREFVARAMGTVIQDLYPNARSAETSGATS